MTTRADFLDRVREALRRPSHAPTTPAPRVEERLVRLAGPDDDLANLFVAKAAAAGLVVHRCGVGDAAKMLRSLLDSLRPACVVLDELDPPLKIAAAAALAGSTAKVLQPRATRSLDSQFDADVGITGVLAAIAETGTLVVAPDAVRSRGTFMIPPVHIALVLESQLIPDLIDLWPRLGATIPTAVTLISGPSKTADIEGILVTGVHGPGAVHVLLAADRPVDAPPQRPPHEGEQP
jgi:L-lactate dehydrogenase complex protein LldG